MERVRRSLPVSPLFLLRLAFATLLFYSCVSLSACDPVCDWELTAHTWEDVNSNGIQDSDEPPLENIAITSGETRSGHAGNFFLIDGTDKDGQAPVVKHIFGQHCPERVQVKAFAPGGYVPTTPDQTTVTDKSTTSIGFGFRRVPGSKLPVRLTGTAQCSEARFQHAGWYISGAVVRPNGDMWLTSQGQGNGGVTLRRDGTEYSQDIDGFGPYASDIAAAPDGTIWVAGGIKAGVARFDGTSWENYTTANSALPSNDVTGIEVTRDGHAWALTSAGIADFDPVSERWRSYSDVGSGFSQVSYANDAMWLLSSTDNVMWLVDWDGLTTFQTQSPRDTVRRIPVKLDSVSSVNIWNAAVAADGSVWLVGFADEWPMVVRHNPSTDQWTNYTYLSTRGSLPLVFFNSVGILSDGAVLVGAGKWGAIRLSPDDNPVNVKWTAYPALVQYARQGGLGVLTILENGDVWFSSGGSENVLMCKLSQ